MALLYFLYRHLAVLEHGATARQERVLSPTAGGEIYVIVTHRLVKSVNRQAVEAIVDQHVAYYRAMMEINGDLPQRCVRAEYGEEIDSAYPFHPELLNTLNHMTATFPNFNQKRGALRLLAWTVRTLWQKSQTIPGLSIPITLT